MPRKKRNASEVRSPPGTRSAFETCSARAARRARTAATRVCARPVRTRTASRRGPAWWATPATVRAAKPQAVSAAQKWAISTARTRPPERPIIVLHGMAGQGRAATALRAPWTQAAGEAKISRRGGPVLEGKKIAVLGVGKIGEALIRGLLARGASAPSIAGTVAREESRPRLERLGIRLAVSNAEAVADADVVLIAVKPQQVSEVVDEIHEAIRPDALV